MVKSQKLHGTVVTSDAMVLTVPPFVHKDTDQWVDGESSARPITPGPTPNSPHVSLAQAWMTKFRVSMPKLKPSWLKISQLLNFSVVTHQTNWS